MARISPTGWTATTTDDGVTVRARLRERDGHVVVSDLFISGDDLTADTLRRIQPGRIVAGTALGLVNDIGGPSEPGRVGESGSRKGLTFAELVRKYHGYDDTELKVDDLRSLRPVELGQRKPQPVGRPDGTDPDAFYARVAEAYRSAAAASNKPAVTLAEENDVPVDTARGWIREARRRGFLERGRKGHAQ